MYDGYSCDGYGCENSCMGGCNGWYFGSKNKFAPKGVHIMNKAEGKVMRKLQSQTGMSEEEIRSIKKYRKMLSDAQVEGTKRKFSAQERILKGIMKTVTQELKLPKEHPKCVAKFNEKVNAIKNGKTGYFYSHARYILNRGW